jgi:hypothetical protein
MSTDTMSTDTSTRTNRAGNRLTNRAPAIPQGRGQAERELGAQRPARAPLAVGRAQVEYCHKYETTGKAGGVATGVDHIFVKHACFERKVAMEDTKNRHTK